MNIATMIAEFQAPGNELRSAKIMSWLDNKLEEIQKGDIADRLLGAQTIKEFFDNYYHFYNLGSLNVDERPEDDTMLKEDLEFEQELRAAWCSNVGNPFEPADFEC